MQALMVSWKTRMSGGASVVLAFLAVFLPAKLSKDALFCAAGSCILYAAYGIWAVERNNLAALAESLTRLICRLGSAAVIVLQAPFPGFSSILRW